jgi:hypothetical protein
MTHGPVPVSMGRRENQLGRIKMWKIRKEKKERKKIDELMKKMRIRGRVPVALFMSWKAGSPFELHFYCFEMNRFP